MLGARSLERVTDWSYLTAFVKDLSNESVCFRPVVTNQRRTKLVDMIEATFSLQAESLRHGYG